MSQNMITLLTVLVTALSTLGGVLITSIINSRNARITQESEERKHYRDLLFKTAIEYWQAERKELPYLPLEQYIVSMDAFYTLFMEENPSEEKVQKKMAARQAFLAKREEFLEQQKKDYLKEHGQSNGAT